MVVVHDWRFPFVKADIDVKAYNDKFLLCEKYFGGDDKLLPVILRDKTTFAYTQFFDGEHKHLELYDFQDALINDFHRFIFFRAANQIGKSFFIDVKAAINLLLDHGHAHNEAIISKSLQQSMFQMRRVRALLGGMKKIKWKEERGGSDSMSVISVDVRDDFGKVKYSNLLICCPCTESLLGYDLHELNLDEFEYWDVDLKYFFEHIAQPRTYSTKGRIFVLSNPNGEESYGAVLENQRLGNNLKWHVYVFDFLAKPGNTVEEYEQLRLELDKRTFESTVAAIRSKGSNSFFSGDEIKAMGDKFLRSSDGFGRETAWFLDVGTVHDQSVLCGAFVEKNPENESIPLINVFYVHKYPRGYPLARVVGVRTELCKDDGWDDYVVDNASVVDVLNEYSEVDENNKGVKYFPLFGCDCTGNAGMIPLFNSVDIGVVDIIFSGKSKWKMYLRLQYYLQQRWLKKAKDNDDNTINGKDGDYQFSKIVEVKGLANTYKRVRHESEEDLDDVPDAIAGLVYLIENPDLPSLSFGIVDTKIRSGKVVCKEKVKSLAWLDEQEKEINNQHIPSFMRNDEFECWFNKRKSIGGVDKHES